MAVIIPPAQFDHAPPMPVIEHVMSADEVTRLCSLMLGPHAGGWLGCGRVDQNGKCYIVHVGDKEVRRHERAHCAGWPATHPGGVER